MRLKGLLKFSPKEQEEKEEVEELIAEGFVVMLVPVKGLPKVAARLVRSMPARLSLVPVLKGDSADSVSGESKVVGGFRSAKLLLPVPVLPVPVLLANCWYKLILMIR